MRWALLCTPFGVVSVCLNEVYSFSFLFFQLVSKWFSPSLFKVIVFSECTFGLCDVYSTPFSFALVTNGNIYLYYPLNCSYFFFSCPSFCRINFLKAEPLFLALRFSASPSLLLFSLSNADLSSFNDVTPGMPENAPAVWNASLPSYLQARDPNSCCPQQLSPQHTHPDPTKPCANSFALLQLNLPISNFYKHKKSCMAGWVSKFIPNWVTADVHNWEPKTK